MEVHVSNMHILHSYSSNSRERQATNRQYEMHTMLKGEGISHAAWKVNATIYVKVSL